jgi:DNA mismatch repair ATPase MutS
MDRLERLTVLADARFGLTHFFVQVLFLWDFHLGVRFERWREHAGGAARGWLEALGEAEALSALAALAHAQPDWAFPEVDPGLDGFDARDLGHPLIPDSRRVGNDVTVGPPGTFLLVTGSNMSGKTTLLRSIGANAVLAWAGGPACARELRLPPVRLATSIAVEDSLEEGVSFFLAELLRLKAVVAEAERAAAESTGAGAGATDGARVLYLLDEVLRGTNSAERRVAVQRVVGRLVALGAIGAVTTHDLELLREDEPLGGLERAARPIHFRETIRPRPDGGAEMTFDYVARPGLATTTNALRLLEAVGLGEEGGRG